MKEKLIVEDFKYFGEKQVLYQNGPNNSKV